MAEPPPGSFPIGFNESFVVDDTSLQQAQYILADRVTGAETVAVAPDGSLGIVDKFGRVCLCCFSVCWDCPHIAPGAWAPLCSAQAMLAQLRRGAATASSPSVSARPSTHRHTAVHVLQLLPCRAAAAHGVAASSPPLPVVSCPLSTPLVS